MVEQRTENPRVTGSIPVLGTAIIARETLMIAAFPLLFDFISVDIYVQMRYICIIRDKYITLRKEIDIMKKSKWTAIVIPGVICGLVLIVSVWYSVKFNESRLVVKTDLETYQFSPKDLPMICSIVLSIAYIWYLMICLGKTSIQQKKNILKTNRTRTISPKLGFLGFLGFMGFRGFLTYSAEGRISPFISFVFLGFFGFFYEGKMSNTLRDERFKENVNKAQVKALKVAFTFIIVELFFLPLGEYFMGPEYMLIVLYILIALSVALVIFLSEYLLYRYDHDEYAECEYSEEYSEKKNDNEECNRR